MQKKSKPKVPSIVHHKARNADVVFLRGADEKRPQVYLGPHGSDQARRRSPHRLRHAKGTELARTEEIDVARIALGHKDDRVTRRYAVGAGHDLAVAVARRYG